MRRKSYLLVLLALLLCQVARAQQLTINVEKGGTLASLITDDQKYNVTDLTLTGEINGNDIIVLRDMCGINKWGSATEGKLENIDLSGVKVVASSDAITGISTDENKFGKNIFKGVPRLKTIKLPAALTGISEGAFKKCTALTSVEIPASVTTIGASAFEGCTGLTTFDIPSTVTTLSSSVFYNCKSLESVTLPSSITSIGMSLFQNCTSLKTVSIPDGVTVINSYAFSGCTSLESITLPSKLTNLEKYSFEQCTSLSQIDIPASVTLLGGYVFKNCSALKTVYMRPELKDGKPVMNSGNFDGIAQDHVIYVPRASYDAYKASVLKGYNIQPYDYVNSITPPFDEPFDSADALKDWTIIDVNNDGITWHFYEDTAGDKQMMAEYNTEKEMDDWLITPPIHLEAGKLYNVSADVKAMSEYCPERIAFFYGTAPTVEAMTNVIVDATTIVNEEYKPYGSGIVVKETGDYYIGFHGISTLEGFWLYLDNVKVSAPMSANVPGEIKDLTVTPDATGQLKAEVSFTAPDVNLKGDKLTSLTKIELYCNDKLVNTFTSPAIGSKLTYTYEASQDGEYSFKAIPSNEDGDGLTASAPAVHIGIYAPAAPSKADIVETSEGSVKVTWTAPTKDVNGNDLLSQYPLTYAVADVDDSGNANIIKDNIETREFDYKVMEAGSGKQDFVYYGVFSHNRAGYSTDGTFTPMIPVGTPYKTPYVQSFANGTLDGYILGTEALSGYGQWGVANDSKFKDVSSVDGDNGYVYMNGDKDEAARLYTGKIAVTGTNPVFSFYYLPLGDNDTNVLTVSVSTLGGDVKELCSVTQGGANVWTKKSVSMKDYIGKTVQLYIDGKIVSHAYIVADNFRINDLQADNLGMMSMKAPSFVYTDGKVELSAVVENRGTAQADGYSVNVYRDGELLKTIDTGLPALAQDETAVVKTTDEMSVAYKGVHTYYMEVVSSSDQDLSDNKTSEVSVKVLLRNQFPTVTIEGSYDKAAHSTTLTWQPASAGEGVSAERVEDFEDESYTPFTFTDFGPWTLLNNNNNSTYKLNGYNFENQGEPFGFILFDSSLIGSKKGQELFAGSEGSSRSLMAFAHESGQNDAWLISPKLSGDAQTVKFRARAFSDQYGKETFEVLYSSTDKNTASFSALPVNGYDTEKGASTKWTEYTVDLPASAKYFAIHSTATDAFVLQIDSIAYNGYPAFADLVAKGYNIYRDNVKINDALVKETSFTDKAADTGSHKYGVTVVYDQGESAMSNIYESETSGIADLTGSQNYFIKSEPSAIVFFSDEAHSVTITTVDGRMVYDKAQTVRARVNVVPGIYLVTVDGSTRKLAVK